MFMGEDLLVPSTQIAHCSLVYAAYMSMKVRPSHARNIAVLIGAVVAQQKDCVLKDVGLLVADS